MNNYMKTIISGLKQWVSSQKSDWNQNDSSAANFIKNRPFYSEEKEKILFSSDALSSQEFILSQPLEKGKTYTVVFNGVTYNCLAREYSGYIMIGNNAVYGYDSGIETDTGEPFALEQEAGYTYTWIYYADTVTEAPSIIISGTIEEVHKIDKKYVPVPDLAPVATSGDYYDLENTPYIPWDVVQYNETQYLIDDQKLTARTNIGASGATNLLNGILSGSLRSYDSAKESSDYSMGYDSVAFGRGTKASGYASYAEGCDTTASGDNSHAEGVNTTASGTTSHAEGGQTQASGDYSHAEGSRTAAYGMYSHSEGFGKYTDMQFTGDAGSTVYTTNKSLGITSGITTGDIAIYNNVSAEIISIDSTNKTITLNKTLSENALSSAAGKIVTGGLAYGENSHSEGKFTKAIGSSSHAEGSLTEAIGNASHAEGYYTTTFGQYSHGEGWSSSSVPHTITPSSSIDYIYETWSDVGTKFSLAKGSASHIEGFNTIALASSSHAEGSHTVSYGSSAHAEGYYTKAMGNYSHAEGKSSIASGDYSHAEGYYTIAASQYQHAQGQYNIEDSANKYAHIVGNGESDTARSNAHTLDWNGVGWFAGTIKVGGTSQDDENASEVVLMKDLYAILGSYIDDIDTLVGGEN